jgi:hypothetical protein
MTAYTYKEFNENIHLLRKNKSQCQDLIEYQNKTYMIDRPEAKFKEDIIKELDDELDKLKTEMQLIEFKIINDQSKENIDSLKELIKQIDNVNNKRNKIINDYEPFDTNNIINKINKLENEIGNEDKINNNEDIKKILENEKEILNLKKELDINMLSNQFYIDENDRFKLVPMTLKECLSNNGAKNSLGAKLKRKIASVKEISDNIELETKSKIDNIPEISKSEVSKLKSKLPEIKLSKSNKNEDINISLSSNKKSNLVKLLIKNKVKPTVTAIKQYINNDAILKSKLDKYIMSNNITEDEAIKEFIKEIKSN